MLNIAIVVLQAQRNRIAELKVLIPRLLEAISLTRPGLATVIGPL